MTYNRNPQLFTKEDIQEIITGKVTKRSRPSHPESRLQCSCVQWFRLQHPDKRLLLFAVPNGGFRIASEAARLYAEGVVPGVSDLIYLEPRGGYGALCIEMKTTLTGSRQSDRQKEWQKAWVSGTSFAAPSKSSSRRWRTTWPWSLWSPQSGRWNFERMPATLAEVPQIPRFAPSLV